MTEKDPISKLKGKGLEISRSSDEPTLLGALATRSAEAMESVSRLKGKGLDIARDAEPSDIEEGRSVYLSTKNGDLYEIVDDPDRPVREGLVKLRNTRNLSTVTLAADVLDDPDRFTLHDGRLNS